MFGSTPLTLLTCGSTAVRHDGSPGFVYLEMPRCGLPENLCKSTANAGALECEIANGYPCGSPVGEFVLVMKGNHSGPARQGWAERFATDTDKRDGLCFADYTGNGKRSVVMPMVEIPAGGQTRILGYAQVFVRSLPADDSLDLEFQYLVVRGAGGPTR